MKDLDLLTLRELISPEGYDCECGEHHECPMDYLKIGRGCLGDVPEMLKAAGSKKPFIVFDKNTRAAAGDAVCACLKEAGIPFTAYEIPERGHRISPAEWETGSVIFHFDTSCDFILGVGSGVVNDICKVTGHATGRKTGIVGTAPSMDGYASDSSSMEVNNVKVTLPNHAPCAILLDTDILCQAPMRMLQAGFGDMIAKAIALCEWRISHIVTGEKYCPQIARLTRSALNKVISGAKGIPDRDPDAVQSIAEGLVISGIAMAYCRASRPASGLEHYYSHMWEMMALDRHRPYDLHGIQVGVGTMLTLQLYDQIRLMKPDRAVFDKAAAAFDEPKWADEVRRIFGGTAEQIFGITASAGLNDPAKRLDHFEKLSANWDEVLDIINEELPDYKTLLAMAREIGMPCTPEEIGISQEDTRDAYAGSRNLRNKYLTSTLLWELGANN